MNKKALASMIDKGWTSSEAQKAIAAMIDAGFIEDDPMTEPEYFAQAAKDWVGSAFDAAQVFGFATGWSTEAWETVLDEKFEHDLSKQKNVFAALVLLAKEGGVEL